MFKRITYILITYFLITFNSHSNANVFIYATVNDQIITNYDIQKEIVYLKILNPQLSQVDSKQVFQIGKDSLINEVVKLNEIKKVFDLKIENEFVNDYLKQFYTKLNFNSIEEFEQSLLISNNYSLNEIKQKLKVEILWNELIYLRYNNQIKINEDLMIKKIESLDKKTRKEYLLSEIVFEKKKDQNLSQLIGEIKSSIKEIGFNNTANIYSISDSSKLGGKIGWIDENNLSETIYVKLKNIKENQYTDTIQIGNNFLILKVEKIKIKEISIDKEQELKNMIKFETNKQLNQFSKIFFDKSKINYSINEK